MTRIALLACAAVLLTAGHRRAPEPDYAPTMPVAPPPAAANGAIFQVDRGFTPLTSGARAGSVGDVLTITLVERTQGQSTSTSQTAHDGSIGLVPPSTGPLSLFAPTDAQAGGNSTFQGSGQTGQANSLVGEISVTVTRVLPNGALMVRGEKQLRINRGNETIRLSGIVRPSDIGADNRVPSTRLADARIDYVGRGEISRASRQGWLQRLFSIITPF
jgi:flagellar L-ring protein precursor FlgH